MKAKATIFFGAVFLVFCKCFAGDDFNVTNIFGDSAVIIANADSVKAWRTLGSVEVEQYDQGKRVDFNPADFYLKSGDPILVSTNLAARLSKSLLDLGSYLSPYRPMIKRCEPQPGVVVTFSEGNKRVDVFFCFDCKILIANNVQSDFDPGAPAILKIVKEIFPNDPQIQSLKDS